VRVASEESLIRLLRYVGATDAEIEEVQECIRRWGRGASELSSVPAARACSAYVRHGRSN
jgi:hypothetical protein